MNAVFGRWMDAGRAGSMDESATKRLRSIKIVCAVVLSVCFWFSVPYAPVVQGPTDLSTAGSVAGDTGEGALGRQIALPIIAGIGIYMLWRLPRRGRMDGSLRVVLGAFAGWAALSVMWSDSPATSAKRLIVFAMDALFAYAIARVFSLVEMALWGCVTTGCVALISLYVDAGMQRIFAPFDPDYRFAGVMQPNYQAMNLVVCIFCGLTLLAYARKSAKWIVGSLGVALVLLYLTRSRLGAAVCLALAAFPLARLARDRMAVQTRALVVLAMLVVALPVGIYFAGQNAGGAAESVFMMGRSDTENTASLSNRAPLWAELMESAEARPWLGYGYGGFWTPERLERVSLDQGWIVPHAHDTYLDEGLALGLVGALLYAGALWGGVVIAWQRYRRRASAISLLPALLLTWLAVTGLAESLPLDPYLPTMLAYGCLLKMCLVEGSEEEEDWSAEGVNPKHRGWFEREEATVRAGA